MADRIGELLVRENLISLAQLQRAQADQRSTGKRLTASLARLGFLPERQLADFLSEHHKVAFFDFAADEVDPEVIRLVPRAIASKYLAIPVQRAGSKLIVAMADPSNLFAIDDLKFHTSFHVEPVVSTESAIEAAIARYYDHEGAGGGYGEVLGGLGLEPAQSVPAERERPAAPLSEPEQSVAGRLCDAILRNAVGKGASDIHIEPYERGVRVRYRIDGALHHEMDPPLGLGAALTNRLKQLAGLDVGDRRTPAEGRLRFKAGKDRDVDLRLVTLPTVHGEALRLRLLDRSALPPDLSRLGLEPEPLRQLRSALHRPYGLVLVAGPAGAGKSTTLYAALGELTHDSVRIATVEDPVEHHLPGISQVQVTQDGLGPAAAVRAVLRQDPDILVVGELRDFETAELCARAAVGGRRVIAALPAGDAAAAPVSLVHLGVEPHLVAAATSLVLAQRLVRKLCPECAGPDPTCTLQRLVDAGLPTAQARDARPRRGRGCKSCHGGFRGRAAIFEVLPVGDALRERIAAGAGAAELRAEAIRLGMRALRQAALQRVLEGVTTLDEAVRATLD